MARLKKEDKLLLNACEEGDLQGVKGAIKNGANPNCAGSDTPLVCAIREGYDEIVEFLLSLENIDINAVGRYETTAIQAAASVGNKQLFRKLFSMGVDVTSDLKKGSNALRQAAYQLGTEEVDMLLKAGVPVDITDDFGKTLLHDINNIDLIQMLLSRGADVNACSKSQATPLHDAAHYGNFEKVRVLLDNGADINVKDEKGNTPLFDAIYPTCYETNEHWEKCGPLIKILVDRGADINIKNNRGDTPLINAAFGNRHETIQFLISKGAEIDAVNNKGTTAFYETAVCPSFEAAKILFESGSDINIKNESGLSTLDLALSQQKSVGIDPDGLGLDQSKEDAGQYDDYINWLKEIGVTENAS